MTWSKLKPAEKFLYMWNEHGYPKHPPEQEVRFDPIRRFRFDFAWPEYKVAVEIHGFGFGHQSIAGLANDCEKLRLAMAHEWIVIPFSSACIGTKEKAEDAVVFVCEMISRRHGKVEWN